MTTTNELTGRVPGDTLTEQAVFLAGLLAEQSVLSVSLVDDDASRPLAARRDDLPGLIEAAINGARNLRLICESLDLTVDLHAASLRWRTRRASTAALFQSQK